MTEPQRIQHSRSAAPSTDSRPSPQGEADTLLRDARHALARAATGSGTPAERQQALNALMTRASRLPQAGVWAATVDSLRSVFGQLEAASQADAHEQGIETVDWMRSARTRPRANAHRTGVSRAASGAISTFETAIRDAPEVVLHADVPQGVDGLTREIVAHLDVCALAANFTRQQITDAAIRAGARPTLAAQLAEDVATHAQSQLASGMIDVAQARLRDLSAHVHEAAVSPDQLVAGLLAAPRDGLRLLHELGVPADELQRLGADINRFNDPASGLSHSQRNTLHARIVGRTMGLAEDASRSAASAAAELDQLREEDPERIFATFPWAAEEAARSLSIDRATASRIAHGNGTGSLLARAVHDRREAIESHDRMVEVGIKVGILLAQIATSVLASPLAGALVGATLNAGLGVDEVMHAREMARLTQGAAATGLNSHGAGEAARREADSAETAAVAEVALSAMSQLNHAPAHLGLGHVVREVVDEAATDGVVAGVRSSYLERSEASDRSDLPAP